jgi:hypothetical protein
MFRRLVIRISPIHNILCSRPDSLYFSYPRFLVLITCVAEEQVSRTFYQQVRHTGTWALERYLSPPPTSPSRRQNNMDRASQVLAQGVTFYFYFLLLVCLNHIVHAGHANVPRSNWSRQPPRFLRWLAMVGCSEYVHCNIDQLYNYTGPAPWTYQTQQFRIWHSLPRIRSWTFKYYNL